MKKIIILLFFLSSISIYSQDGENEINYASVELARILSKDIFDLNGVPFTTPLVEATNATSNSGFFIDAHVPQKDSLYFKFSVSTMLGFVPNDQKFYKPEFPTQKFSFEKATKFIDFKNGEFLITDTVKLYSYLLQTLLYDGIQDGTIKFPESTATIFGSGDEKIKIEEGSLENNAEKRITQIEETVSLISGEEVRLDSAMRNEIKGTLSGLPGFFSLPNGANVNSLFFLVPQLEVGSFLGTEALIRFIPPLDYGETIGTFGFYGLALKHSISQYFFDTDEERTFDLAVQAAYQETTLENEIGLTGAQLNSNADLFNVNLHASKEFEDLFDVYTGISFEQLNISADFTYRLPVEAQAQLGLRRVDRNEEGAIIKIYPAEPPTYPGDTKPQTSYLNIEDFNIKWIIGVKRDIGPVSIFASYNFSKFNILNSGIQYNF